MLTVTNKGGRGPANVFLEGGEALSGIGIIPGLHWPRPGLMPVQARVAPLVEAAPDKAKSHTILLDARDKQACVLLLSLISLCGLTRRYSTWYVWRGFFGQGCFLLAVSRRSDFAEAQQRLS